MELLLQAIEEKLSHVDSERNRWLQYNEEHIQAANNLRDFQTSFRKDILVPIGSKALMPGQLYHTNEIFVGMYRGLFVKCSADKALSVCEHRLGEAKKRIESLDVEYKMYRDRLELPVDEQVFGNAHDAQEIIEEYNEEEEQKWRDQHKISVRDHKKAEAEQRKQQHHEIVDIDINAILEEAELMEELENELEELNIEDDDGFKEHLQSNMAKLEQIVNDTIESPAYMMDDAKNADDEDGTAEFLQLKAQATDMNTDDTIEFYGTELKKTREFISKTPCTIHNFNEVMEKRVTEECLMNAIEELQETLNNDIDPQVKQPAKNIDEREPAAPDGHSTEPRKFHTRADFDAVEQEYNAQNKSKSEILVFYKSQLRNVMKSIAGCSIDKHSTDEKRDLYEFLSDRISSLRDDIQREKQIKFEEEFVDDDDIDKPVRKLGRPFDPESSCLDLDEDKDDELTGKRKISFASQPITVTFYEDEEPSAVSQESLENLMDSTFQFFNSPSSSSASSVCGDDDDNTNPRNEHLLNSTNDCDTNFSMNHFNESTMKKVEDESGNNTPGQTQPSTLILQFNHTANPCTSFISNDDETINSPLDIYRQFGIMTDAQPVIPSPHHNSVSQLSLSHLEDRLNKKNATETSQFSATEKMVEVPNIDAKPTKSILKNGNLVKNEKRAMTIADEYEEPPTTIEPSEDFTGFTQVLGEIVERNSTDESNTLLNQSDNIQSNEEQPKKRVSLFKRSRMS